MRLFAVTGMRAEAEVARRLGLEAVCGGGHPPATAAAIRRAIDAGAEALLSFGIAGGLAPDLRPGTIIVADGVVGASRAPLALPVDARRGPVTAAESIVAESAAKAALQARTGALCVDLESGLVAASGLPYGVLRAIGDPAERSLPPAALVGLKPDGTPDVAAVLRSLARAPGQLPSLLRVALEARTALRALARLGRIEV
jgi:adenosylhomocysteine nucleosidase